jgi:predicted RNase H-like HicB family nuclease
MKYGILLEKISEPDFEEGYFYAHIPTLGLTTHGLGIEGALFAAKDLLNLWIEEKKANNEIVSVPSETYYSVVDIEEYALQT